MKPRIKCYTLWNVWWFLFPDGSVARADGNDHETYEDWKDLYEFGQVPFLMY